MDSDMLPSPSAKLFCLSMEGWAQRARKHDCKPTETVKMGGKVETRYPLKSWPSLILMNCSSEDLA
jgi:hypothetical protein